MFCFQPEDIDLFVGVFSIGLPRSSAGAIDVQFMAIWEKMQICF